MSTKRSKIETTQPSRPLIVEELEDRTVPATFATPWPEPEKLTLSFTPDAAEIGHAYNDLFETLNQHFNTQQWQTEILRAFQSWAVHINANIGIVSDTGAAFGAIGLTQHDPRFGDIRIAGFAQADDIIANNVPYQAAAGSWAGDVFLNTAANLTIGNTAFDLFSVMINEAGNVFGLEDGNDRSSVMYTDYAGLRTGLSAMDIARIQELYGARTADSHEGSRGNNSIGNARRIQTPLLDLGADPIVVNADITTLQDRDFYEIRTPLNARSVELRLKTNGVSLLTGKLAVYNQFGKLVQSVTADSVFDGNLSIRLNTLPGLSYYVMVEGAVDDVFGIGAYQLEVDYNALAEPLVQGVVDTLDEVELIDRLFTDIGLVNKENNSNNSFQTATQLITPPGYEANTRFEAVESLSTTTDIDFYRFQAPATRSPVMLITIGSLGDIPSDFEVTVFDANQQPVEARVFRGADGELTIEVRDAKPDAEYFLKITSEEGAQSSGNYFVVIDFGSGAAQLENVASGTLNKRDPVDTLSLNIGKSQLFRFDLSAFSRDATGDNAVQMAIFDSRGNLVFSMTVLDGDLQSRFVWLDKGDYVVRIGELAKQGARLRPINYRLDAAALSDDIGPTGEDTTETPINDPAYGYPPDEYGAPPEDDSSASMPEDNTAPEPPPHMDTNNPDYDPYGPPSDYQDPGTPASDWPPEEPYDDHPPEEPQSAWPEEDPYVDQPPAGDPEQSGPEDPAFSWPEDPACADPGYADAEPPGDSSNAGDPSMSGTAGSDSYGDYPAQEEPSEDHVGDPDYSVTSDTPSSEEHPAYDWDPYGEDPWNEPSGNSWG